MAGRPGQGETRAPISVVVNTILGFKTQAIAQREIRFRAPIVLIEKRAVEQKRTGQRILDYRGLILRGRLRQVLVDRSKQIVSVGLRLWSSWHLDRRADGFQSVWCGLPAVAVE